MNKYIINPHLIVQKKGKKVTVFHGEKSLLINFNETASFVFLKLKQKKDVNSIINEYAANYGITQEHAEKDIKEVVKKLLKNSLFTEDHTATR